MAVPNLPTDQLRTLMHLTLAGITRGLVRSIAGDGAFELGRLALLCGLGSVSGTTSYFGYSDTSPRPALTDVLSNGRRSRSSGVRVLKPYL